jgi:hypothetical protein
MILQGLSFARLDSLIKGINNLSSKRQNTHERSNWKSKERAGAGLNQICLRSLWQSKRPKENRSSITLWFLWLLHLQLTLTRLCTMDNLKTLLLMKSTWVESKLRRLQAKWLLKILFLKPKWVTACSCKIKSKEILTLLRPRKTWIEMKSFWTRSSKNRRIP